MAVINKIRDKSWLVLVFVGVALLTFLFSDWSSILGGSGYEYGYGTVNGEMVDMDDWQDAIDKERKNIDIRVNRARAQGRDMDSKLNEDQVWNNFVKQIVLEKEYEALGINISDKEFNSYLYAKDGFGILPEFNDPRWIDPTGNLIEDSVKNTIKFLEKNDKDFWDMTKESLRERRLEEKYKTIVKQSIFVTDLEAQDEFVAMNEVKSVSFIYQSFATVPDESIKVDDAKLKAYFEKHKTEKIYENKEAQRQIKYLYFRFDPSKEDSTEFMKKMAEYKTGLQNSTNDSIYAVKNSELRLFTSQVGYLPTSSPNAVQGLTYPAEMDTVFKNAAIGDVIGPYVDNTQSSVAKVIGKSPLMSVRHILISANKNDTLAVEKARVKADSIKAIANNANFEKLVNEFSEDHQPNEPVKNGGKYEQFGIGRMVPEFTEFAKTKSIGEIGIVQTDYGFHIIEVLEREENVVPLLAVVKRTLKTSQETRIQIKKDVTQLLLDLSDRLAKISDPYKKVVEFDTIISQKGLDRQVRPVTINDRSPRVGGLQTEKAELDILELAYNEEAKVGDLIGSPIQDKDTYILAILAGVIEKGPGKYEDHVKLVTRKYMNEEKAKVIEKRMNGVKTLEALEWPEKNIKVENAEVTFGAGTIGNISNERRVAGIIFSGIHDGTITKPIRGEQGVFVIKVKETRPADVQSKTNFDVERNNILQSRRNSIDGQLVKALEKQADVIDNRKLLQKGIRY